MCLETGVDIPPMFIGRRIVGGEGGGGSDGRVIL